MMKTSRKIWVAIVPALIAGIFAIIPFVYERIVAPKDRLIYSVSSSAAIATDGGYQSIYVLNIRNDGSTKLKNIVGALSITHGAIESHEISAASGLLVNTTERSGSAHFEAGLMHPGEKFGVTALVFSKDRPTEPVVSVRSDQVLGVVAEDDAPSQKDKIRDVIAPALSATLGVFAFALLMSSRSIGPFNIFRVLLMGDKHDSMQYIAARAGLLALADSFRTEAGALTYRRAG